jgi:hypothetical protein
MTNGQDELILDTRISGVSSAYEQYCQQRIAQLEEQFKRLQIQYIHANAETDIPRLVRQTFPRRSRG